tara:strand:+ start:853 stop:1353 length:501 start_codon:yes stop_codon:yes gene_type:complete
MKKAAILFMIFCFVLTSCGSSKKVPAAVKRTRTENSLPKDQLLINVVNNARKFEGTRYKFGGTTSKGMDCSGLVYVAYQQENIALPRVSRDMAGVGKEIKTDAVHVGDLLFFKTNRSSRINHVGMVVDILPGQILFIHSTTSQGVIISSLNEGYWNNAYTEARRII